MAAVRAQMLIDRLGAEGDGLAQRDGRTVAVPFALPGERVVDGTLAASSPERVEPVCRHFGTCGNCVVQHLAARPMLAWKRDKVAGAFRKAGLDVAPEPTIPVPLHSRRRVTFTAFREGEAVRLGYLRRRSHEPFAVEECPILVPAIVAALPALVRVAQLAWRGAPQLVVTAAADGLDVCIRREAPLLDSERRPLAAAAVEFGLARLAFGPEVLLAPGDASLSFGDVAVTPPPGAFLQATEPSEEAMAALVVAHLGKAKRAADLFAGCGTFALRLKGQVSAFEADAAALAALASAANAAGRPVATERRDLFERPLTTAECERFDAIVLDPPRAGARAQCEQLARATVPKLAYVSCNPSTLARDAAALVEGGHRLVSLTPVDQFLYSAQVEAVALFERARVRKRALFG